MLTGHEKGVLSLAWCQQDANLLVSCGKDCRTLVWNPNVGELVAEVNLLSERSQLLLTRSTLSACTWQQLGFPDRVVSSEPGPARDGLL